MRWNSSRFTFVSASLLGVAFVKLIGAPPLVGGTARALAAVAACSTSSASCASAPDQPSASTSTEPPPHTTTSAASRTRRALGRLPVSFIENRGQLDRRVAYYAPRPGMDVYFTAEGVTYVLTRSQAVGTRSTGGRSLDVRDVSAAAERSTPKSVERWAVKLDFVNASRAHRPIGRGQTPTVISYFRGQRNEWKTRVPAYGEVAYRDLWPGIDLVYAGQDGQLKYTFLVRPGADPNQIRLAYRGASGVRLTDAGQLEVSTPIGGMREERPYVYQDLADGRANVAADYHLAPNGQYGFRVGKYDRRRPLVIDPVVLQFAGYVGGTGQPGVTLEVDDEADDIELDADGNVYIVGSTTSSDFPTTVGPDPTFNGGAGPFPADAFVAKLTPDGTSLIYAGYVGGASQDFGFRLAVDRTGAAYITGATTSTEATFPATVGPDLTYNPGFDPDTNEPFPDAFVAKVSPDGTDLIYAGYIGGADEEQGFGIAINEEPSNSGQFFAYVTGPTRSDQTTFPNGQGFGNGPGQFAGPGPDQTFNSPFNPVIMAGPFQDVFVAKVNASGSGLVYAGYIGGSFLDFGQAIAVDKLGNAYVAGSTNSDDRAGDFPGDEAFPVVTGPDLTFNGGFDPVTMQFRGTFDGFVSKVRADGTGLVWSGYIGGQLDDGVFDIALDGQNNVYVAGRTNSDQVDTDINPNDDPVGTTPFLFDFGFPVQVGPDLSFNSTSSACVGGSNQGATCVTASQCPSSTCAPLSDAFVAKVKADGTALAYAGYIGGAGEDRALGIAVDQAGSAYVVGVTNSDETTFPVEIGPDLTFNSTGFNDPIDPTLAASDAFVTKVSSDGIMIVYSGYIGGAQSEHFPRAMGVTVDQFGNAYVCRQTASDETTFPNGDGIGPGVGQFPGPGPDLTYNGGPTDAFIAKVSGTTARARGKGSLDIAGRPAVFSFALERQDTGGPTFGHVRYRTEGVTVTSKTITTVVSSENTVDIAGTCIRNGVPCTFEAFAFAGGGFLNAFFISVNGVPSEGDFLVRGKIRMQPQP